MKRIERLTFLFALALAAPVYLWAQETDPSTPDLTKIVVSAIAALTPVLSVAVLWALKLAWSKIPASLILFLAPLLGMAINFGTGWVEGHPVASPIAAAALGALAVYLREFASTVLSKGFLGPVTVTKGMV